MASTNNKLTNLTDIPLGLDQGDGIDINAAKAEKMKSNSLKRFFRMTKSNMSTSKSSESDGAADAVCESEMKNVRSLQLRFGSFHKNDKSEKDKSIAEPSSSGESLKSKPTETRLKLQERISSYWSTAFKKSLKKSSANDNVQIEDKGTPSLNAIDKIENNQSANL